MIRRNLFYGLMVLAGLAAAYGYKTWKWDPYLVGTVETRLHPVGPREGGTVRQLQVAVGTRVAAGQPLARLDAAELAAEREVLEAQLRALQQALQGDRQLEAVQQELLRLRHAEAWAAVQADRAELRALEREIQALESAAAAGLGHDRDLTRLRIQRDALRASVAQRAQAGPQRTPAGAAAVAGDTAIATWLGGMEDLLEVQRRLARVDQRLEDRTLRAPCAGLVVDIAATEGVAVGAFQPVLTIEDPAVRFVELYVPETQDRQVDVGQPVEIRSRRSERFHTTGRIRFVHPGFAPMPERLWLRGQALWARKLRVELAPDHRLLPGESVRVRILPKEAGDAAPRS